MTIFTKTISLLTLGMSLLSVSGLMSTNVEASDGGYYGNYIVNTPKGINLRDENCNRVNFVGYGTKIIRTSESTINCKVNGRNYKMINIYQIGSGSGDYYVAQDFVSKVIEIESVGYDEAKVNAPSGLTLRDFNCKKVTVVPNNTSLNVERVSGFITCKVNNQYYSLTLVTYNGKQYYAATAFLK